MDSQTRTNSLFNMIRAYEQFLDCSADETDMMFNKTWTQFKAFEPVANGIFITQSLDEFRHQLKLSPKIQNFQILGVDFLSSYACAIKLVYDVGAKRFFDVVSLLLESNCDHDAESWVIVQSVRDHIESSFSQGILFTPSNYDTVDSFADVLSVSQAYIKFNHESDPDSMARILHESTNLYSVDPVTVTRGKLAVRSRDDYLIMMASRTSSLDPRVTQYDRVFKIDFASARLAVVTLQLGLPHVDGRLFSDHLFVAKIDGKWIIVSKTWALHKVPTPA